MKKNRLCCVLWKEPWRKTFRVMKLFILLTCCFTISLSAKTLAQRERLNLNMKNVPILQFFEEISRQTDLHFLYSNELLQNFGQISVEAKNETVEEVLDRVLKNTNLTYAFNEKVIVIRFREDQEQEQKKSKTLKGFVTDAMRQPLPGVTVKLVGVSLGTATNIDGWFSFSLPVDNGTLEFSFVGYESQQIKFHAQTADTLHIVLRESVQELDEVVSLGYYNVAKNKSTSAVTTLKMDDIMQPGVSTLDQMLEGRVPGMIFMQNSGQVGATPKIKIRGTTTLLGSTAPLWVLDGVILQDPVNIDANQINDLDFVNLLGNAISGLNPSDIEQIDVLKDASATAIYGPKASNGVIVITTKKGKVGKPAVTYGLSGTFRRRPRYTDRNVNVMNSRERIAYSREAINAGWRVPTLNAWVGYEAAYADYLNNKLNYEEFVKKVTEMETANTDWLGILLQDTYSHNHTLSISGGTDNMRYYTSIGYMDERGNIRGEINKRYNGMAKLNLNYNNFSVMFSLNGNLQKKEYTPEDVGVADYAYNTSRSVPAYDTDGDLLFYAREEGSDYVKRFNIINEMNNSYNKINTDQLNLQISLGYRIIPSLKADLNFSYGVSHTSDDSWFGEDSYEMMKIKYIWKEDAANSEAKPGEQDKSRSENPSGGELRISNTINENYSLRGTLTYSEMMTENDNLTVSLIGELSSSKYSGFDVTRRGYLPDRGMIFDDWEEGEWPKYDKWLHTQEARGVMTDNLTNQLGLILTASWSHKNHYIFNGNMRMDWSNKFGDRSNEKFLPIWSVSGRWNMHENILYGVSWVNMLALKASFGYQGNMSNTESPKLIIKKGGTNTFFNEFESTIQNFPNPLLKWEKTSNVNVSLDFALFNNKLIGSLGFYYRHTSDAFLSKTVSLFNGTTNYTVNAGTLTNLGTEFNFQFTPINNMINKVTSATSGGIERRGFRWRFDPQLGTVFNQLIDKVKPKDKIIQDEVRIDDYLDGSVQVAGRPVNTFYSYRFKGLNHDTGAPEFYGTEQYYDAVDANGNIIYGGDGKPVQNSYSDLYKNMDKEKVWERVLTHSGCREPFLQGGISNTFEYNNWILSFNLSYSIGAKVRLFKMYDNGGSLPVPERNLRRDWEKRWRAPGDEKYTNIPGIIGGQAFKEMNDPWWRDADWAWTRNVWDMYDFSDIRVASANYLKLSSLQLRYVVPDKLCRKLCMKSAYISVSGTNLFTLTSKKLKGQDPSQSGSTELINISVRPTYSLTLNVTF